MTAFYFNVIVPCTTIYSVNKPSAKAKYILQLIKHVQKEPLNYFSPITQNVQKILLYYSSCNIGLAAKYFNITVEFSWGNALDCYLGKYMHRHCRAPYETILTLLKQCDQIFNYISQYVCIHEPCR